MTARLGDLADVARGLGAIGVAEDALALAERLRDGRFYVAGVGQFKRGKSTLTNALVGEEILPTGVVPVTSVVTVLRHGEQPGARVRLGAGDWVPIDAASLADYGARHAGQRAEAVRARLEWLERQRGTVNSLSSG